MIFYKHFGKTFCIFTILFINKKNIKIYKCQEFKKCKWNHPNKNHIKVQTF